MGREGVHLPKYQGHCVKVSIINAAKLRMQASELVAPAPQRQKHRHLADYSFLIESPHCDEKVIFDLGFLKDYSARMPPSLKDFFLDEDAIQISEVLDIPDTLTAHGIELSTINAVIWSHAHLDHVGDLSVFPPSTAVIVGPGFEEENLPGYPTDPEGVLLDNALQGRDLRELDFSSSTTSIGGFRAIDHFRDGSFWLLEAPGHTEDHICALCRTTEGSWVLLGADICDTMAQVRPSQYRSLPDSTLAFLTTNMSPTSNLSKGDISQGNPQRGRQTPFYGIKPDYPADLENAEESLNKLRAIDGRDDVMIVTAHDATLLDVLDFFPRDINDWKAKGWADQGRWLFLRHMEIPLTEA